MLLYRFRRVWITDASSTTDNLNKYLAEPEDKGPGRTAANAADELEHDIAKTTVEADPRQLSLFEEKDLTNDDEVVIIEIER